MSGAHPLALDLARGLARLGIDLGESAQARLLTYLELMRRWNRTYNLTAIDTPERMLTHHLLDSLAILPHIVEDRLLDVGSGPGLPGVPLALARPGLELTLCESNGKKCAFMRQACIELGLGKVAVWQGRVESFRGEAAFPQIVSRAFSDLAEFTRLTAPLLAPGGRWLAMKGVYPEAEIAALDEIRVVRVVRLDVPGLGAERHLIILDKEHTP